MKKLVLPAICALTVAFASGCMTMPAGYITSTVPLQQGGYVVVAEQVSGIDSQVNVLGFGVAKIGSAQNRAVRDALSKAPGADALIGMSIDVETKNLIFATIITTRVTGTPVKTK